MRNLINEHTRIAFNDFSFNDFVGCFSNTRRQKLFREAESSCAIAQLPFARKWN
jgi:hypothetical protein